MMPDKVYIMPNLPTPNRPLGFDPEICTGCNNCVEVCQVDVLIPHPVKGKPPVVLHPEECWYCGCCVNECPNKGAIQFNWALSQKGSWKRKKTGERFRM